MSVTIEGKTWKAVLTDDEARSWSKYADRHLWLLNASYVGLLEMFLAHYRRGINLAEYESTNAVGA